MQNIINDNNRKIDTLKAYNANINIEIKKYSDELNRFLTKNQIGDVYVCLYDATIYESPGVTFMKPIGEIKKGDIGKVLDDSDEDSYKVLFNGITGYVFKTAIISEMELNKRLEQEKQYEQQKIERQKEQVQEQESAEEKRKNDLIKKYGASDGLRIVDGIIWIGMTKSM